MSITADYHLHSSYSSDSDAPMEEMIQKAIGLGLTDMCFTEHMDIDYPKLPEAPSGDFLVNTDSYLFDLIRNRHKYKDKINVFFGIELGLQPHVSRQIAAFARSQDFDFIIGSTHVVKKRDPYYPSYFEGRTDEECYREYFEEILACMKSFSNFDVYGHIDYVIRYGQTKDTEYSYEKYQDLFEKMIEWLIDHEKGIEINTGGLRKGLREANPCSKFIRRYREMGGEVITVGSDAHRPEDIAADFDRAAQILTDCGFKYYSTFEKRMPYFHKI